MTDGRTSHGQAHGSDGSAGRKNTKYNSNINANSVGMRQQQGAAYHGGSVEGKEAAVASAETHKLRYKLSKAKRLLAQSERERLELRQKYLAIGSSVEQLIRADSDATNADIEKWESRYRALRTKLQTSVKKCKLRAREIATLRGRERDAQKAKLAAESRATKMSEALGECRVDLAKAEGSAEELATAKGRIAALEASLDRLQRDSAGEIDRARQRPARRRRKGPLKRRCGWQSWKENFCGRSLNRMLAWRLSLKPPKWKHGESMKKW